jgi:hypothetical protein
MIDKFGAVIGVDRDNVKRDIIDNIGDSVESIACISSLLLLY